MDLEDVIYIEKKLICGNLNDIDLVYDELDFFQTLNRFAYQNVGLFCLNETYIYNYKRIIEKYEDERYKYTRELLESYTFIMRFENLTNEEKEEIKINYLNKIKEEHEIDKELTVSEALKVIYVDCRLFENLNHFILYYNEDVKDYIKYSMNYFINIDKKNKDLYEDYINLYRENNVVYEHKNNIVNFPKKLSFSRRLFRKWWINIIFFHILKWKGEKYMKKFIPFKKEIPFKTQIAEVTSISLEHNIHKTSDCEISGDFIVSGEYKVTDTSMTTQNFKFDLPFEVSMSDIYDIDDVIIDIDDFYYEIKNMESLEVNITLLLDNIKEKPLIIEEREEKIEPTEEKVEEIEEQVERGEPSEECYEPEEAVDGGDLTRDENIEAPIITENKNVFSFTDDDNESAYIVYIVRENDTVESIMEKYSISIDKLREYNDLSEIKKGDKIIIPNV